MASVAGEDVRRSAPQARLAVPEREARAARMAAASGHERSDSRMKACERARLQKPHKVAALRAQRRRCQANRAWQVPGNSQGSGMMRDVRHVAPAVGPSVGVPAIAPGLSAGYAFRAQRRERARV